MAAFIFVPTVVYTSLNIYDRQVVAASCIYSSQKFYLTTLLYTNHKNSYILTINSANPCIILLIKSNGSNTMTDNSKSHQELVKAWMIELYRLQDQALAREYSKLFNSQTYTIWVDEHNRVIDPPKYDTQSDMQGDHNTMTGEQYILYRGGDERARYKHMRAMLQEIWNIQHMHPAQRFDIDGNFTYNVDRISHYIQRNASASEINRAHEIVKEYYRHRGRGRPKGSRNKSHVLNNSTQTIDIDLGEQTIDQPKQLPPPIPKTNGEVKNLSSDELRSLLENYVTKQFLYDQDYATIEGVSDVATNIEKAVKNYIDTEIKKIETHRPTIIELVRKDLPTLNLGVQHKNFKLLLEVTNSCLRNGNRIIPWVYGPAGTGKSIAAENVAKALGLKCHVMGTTLTKFEVTGFINTSGYQTTPFRQAYEFGGVFCADEMDSWAKEATVALNNGLANSHFAFPDKTVARHKDFVMIVCANTTGAGATLEYVGRNKMDGATLNRFVHIHWPLDEALEDAICANKDWLAYVRRVRNNVSKSNLNPKPLITPRASIFGESLLNSGIEWQIVVDMCLRQGLSETQWGQIK